MELNNSCIQPGVFFCIPEEALEDNSLPHALRTDCIILNLTLR